MTELKRELNRLLQKQEDDPPIKDAQGRFYCQHETCDQPAVTGRHCRHHYLVLWKYLQTKKSLLKEGYLPKSLKSVVNVFGFGGLDFVLRDFKSEKGFEMAAREMSIPLREDDLAPSQKDLDY